MERDMLQSLYSRYYHSALLYCLSLCGRKELAEDIVADAFVKAYLSLSDEIPSFQYWLFRVCKNLWIDHLRKEKHAVSTERMLYLQEGDTPADACLKNERNRCLWRAIETLPSVDREIVTLYYFSGMPVREIAGMIGKSHQAVRQRLTRLRHTLKQRMEEQDDDI